MLQSPSLPFDEYDELSSPDPLATSLQDENRYAGSRVSSPIKARPQSPLRYESILEDITLSTPKRARKKSMKLASSPPKTVPEQTLSPWKIRVTVEAEPDSLNGNTRTMTRTVKVPLREASSPSENISTERRPRVSQSQCKRSGTPLRTRSTSKGRRASVTDLDITVLGDDGDSNDWTRPKSPRKTKPKQIKKVEKANNNDAQTHPEEVATEFQETITRPRRRTVRGRNDFEVRSDTESQIRATTVLDSLESTSPELRKIDLNRVSVRSRSMSTRQKPAPHKDDTIEALMSSPGLPEGTRKVSHNSADSYPTPSPTSSLASDREEQEKLEDPTDDHEGFDTILESEGFTMIDLESIPSARNFLSSPPVIEQSDQGQSQDLKTPAEQSDEPVSNGCRTTPRRQLVSQNTWRTRPTPIPAYLTLPEGESDISSNVPSSPPITSHVIGATPKKPLPLSSRQPTPQPYLSPKLPSPLGPLSPESLPTKSQEKKESPPSLARVVKAGIALQGVLSPKPLSEKPVLQSPYQRIGTPQQRLDGLFDGFDSGTRRELRAGLRLGEELAKRQRALPGVHTKDRESKQTRTHDHTQLQQQPSRTQIWRGEAVMQHTPVISQPKTEDMVEKHGLAELVEAVSDSKWQRCQSTDGEKHFTETTPQQQKPSSTPSMLGTMAKRERQWQQEREAVSKEIENASESQIIVIDSDEEDNDRADDQKIDPSYRNQPSWTRPSQNPDVSYLFSDGGDEDGDPWLAEAEACNSSSPSARQSDEDPFPPHEQHRQCEKAREVVNRPKRSLIPSPWKRGEELAEASTMLTNGDVSGLFWQQKDDREMIKFGSGQIERAKRVLSGGVNGSLGGSQQTKTSLETSGGRTPDTFDEHGHPKEQKDCANHDDHDDHDDRDDDPSPNVLQSTVNVSQPAKDDGEDLDSHDTEQSMLNSEHGFEEEVSQADHTEASSYESPSLPHLPVKVPVKFNDSTLSIPRVSSPLRPPPLTRSSPSQAPDSSRPSTPRSALKGSRLSLGLEKAASPSVRKVIFSERHMALNEDGVEESEGLKSFSSPPPRYVDGIEVIRPQHSEHVRPTEAEVEAKEEQPTLGWFGRIFGGWGSAGLANVAPAPIPSAIPSTDGTIEADNDWQPANMSIPSATALTQVRDPQPAQPQSSHDKPRSRPTRKIPSYLLPPSYPSDPNRDPSIPLATRGDFTNTHFRTLHIIYRKSLGPRFHAPAFPDEVRPKIQALLGVKFTSDESKSTDAAGRPFGVFEWTVGEGECRVVERFMREVERGYVKNEMECRWKWTEKKIMERLFRIVVGEVVRAEEQHRK